MEAIVEARDSEIGTLKALVDIRSDEINGLEETQARTREELELAREERERLQLRYNELGLSLASVQEELEEARTLAGANKEATAAMARQIEVLIEDQSIKSNDLEATRRKHRLSTRCSGKTPVRHRQIGLTTPTCTIDGNPTGSNHRNSNERSDDSTASRPSRSDVCK